MFLIFPKSSAFPRPLSIYFCYVFIGYSDFHAKLKILNVAQVTRHKANGKILLFIVVQLVFLISDSQKEQQNFTRSK